MQHLKIKVCGLREMENIREIVKISPDYMGFIFYKGSKRYAGVTLNADYLVELKMEIKKVGVFVDEEFENILNTVSKYNLDFIQLHGNESSDFCKRLSEHVKIIKAFGIDDSFDFSGLKNFKSVVSYFLFDTKTNNHGGSGKNFDWEALKMYDNEIPFFLSGGIDLEHIGHILSMNDLNIHAIDVNSRFEIEPGLKNVDKIKLLRNAIHG